MIEFKWIPPKNGTSTAWEGTEIACLSDEHGGNLRLALHDAVMVVDEIDTIRKWVEMELERLELTSELERLGLMKEANK